MIPDGFFSSPLAERFSAYVALRRSVGYELRSQVYLLRQFDQIVTQEMPVPGPITREVVAAYLRSLSHLQATTRRVRLCMLRQFLLFLRQYEPTTYIPDRMDDPGHASPRSPYILSETQIAAIIQAAHGYPQRYPVRQWLLYPTLFGLLYVTGMRISEALGLKLPDVDLQNAVIRVRKTKFHKDRLIPLRDSTCVVLRRYLAARAERGYSTAAEAFLFVNEKGLRLPYERRFTRPSPGQASNTVRMASRGSMICAIALLSVASTCGIGKARMYRNCCPLWSPIWAIQASPLPPSI